MNNPIQPTKQNPTVDNKDSLKIVDYPKLSNYLIQEGIKKKFLDVLNDPRKTDLFVTTFISASTLNPKLNECTKESVMSTCLLAASLNLLPSLGRLYLLPFDKKDKSGKVISTICTPVVG